ncbi:CLUMA_CG002419, isoform A [Clunio marinus]|uniref:CLUMA_CG002419, isoform A n=1 Tax=Clunio marinus TaxID=568069 RepID=A0A1J1HQ50_9DIPT|nr:CLUMA_CG002419, isoform A [Clunio marinus]
MQISNRAEALLSRRAERQTRCSERRKDEKRIITLGKRFNLRNATYIFFLFLLTMVIQMKIMNCGNLFLILLQYVQIYVIISQSKPPS